MIPLIGPNWHRLCISSPPTCHPCHGSLQSAVIGDNRYRPITRTPLITNTTMSTTTSKGTASFNANARAFEHTHMADASATIHRYNTSGESSLLFISLTRIELCSCRCSQYRGSAVEFDMCPNLTNAQFVASTSPGTPPMPLSVWICISPSTSLATK